MASLGSEYMMLENIIADKRKEINKLIARKKECGEKLREIMEQKSLESFQNVKYSQVYTKPRPKKMSRKEKEEYAIQKLRQMGIPNPRAALAEMGL